MSAGHPSPGRSRRVLLTGATSQIGPFAIKRLRAAGFCVTALSRNGAPRDLPEKVAWMQTDIADPRWAQEWIRKGEAHEFLLHLAPLPYLPEIIAPLAKTGLRRVIAFGSTSRYTKAGSSDPAEVRLAEALRASESAMEAACEKAGIDWTFFRPTMIYGGRASAVGFIGRQIHTFGFFPLAGAGAGLRQPVHAGDLATACLKALDCPATFGKAYNLGGGEVISYHEMVERIFRCMGRKPRILPLPVAMLRAAIVLLAIAPRFRGLRGAMADRVNADMTFDITDAERDFGYSAQRFLPGIENAEG